MCYYGNYYGGLGYGHRGLGCGYGCGYSSRRGCGYGGRGCGYGGRGCGYGGRGCGYGTYGYGCYHPSCCRRYWSYGFY
ncbi:unnamed protein product [Rangifer tarandus platyrhynchus]|uniref:Keratin-associated protein 20-2-like n=1 Tax=Rangifer tarandus platyrhynchus TaxID=3082113 RepID=A0ABN8ZB86_RANTA|nr:unnamed protein product [Rangifer tarandus platyrhynchus]